MRRWALLAATVALVGYLGYRVLSLERRVEALSRRLGAVPSGSAESSGAAGAGYEQRIAALERDTRSLHEDLRTLELATAEPISARTAPLQPAPDPGLGDQRILSVLGRAQSRIVDRQLEFHRTHWLEQRETAMDDFAARYALSPRQSDQLKQLLADELDRLVDIMKRPDAPENPEKVADDWLAALATTDSAAHRVLDPAQVAAWDTQRMLERKILWPWLPQR